ncbi:MAG: CapA family protein [Bacteroidetes bacterium]|nr:MAG: CapA family protein [Bacteroidota bacterium]
MKHLFSKFLFFICFISSFLAFAQKKNISVIGVGDMMLGTNYPDANYLPPNKGNDLLAPVESILKDADITFGNLEGSVLDKGGAVKSCSDPAKCYAFRMPEYLLDNLTKAGFDLLSVANNHVGDFGNEGRDNMVKVLKEKGFAFAGLSSIPSVSFEKDGVKYGFCAFAPNSGTMDIRDIAGAVKIVKELASKNDIVIVSFHGGAEGASHQHVTKKTENFLGENRGNVYDFAHQVIDAGADIVFGHGPHVTRAVELYKNRFIAYSMGNFCTYKRFNLKAESGLAPIIKVNIDSEGNFLSGKITPIVQPHPGGVQLDSQKRVIAIMQKLTKADFPDTKISISDEGEISIKK